MGKRSKTHGDAKGPSFLQLSLEALEKKDWGGPTYGSYVVRTAHALRKKPLRDLTDEELRLALSQQIGLPWIVELAVERLSEDRFRIGDFYRGDVLVACLRLPPSFWADQPDLGRRVALLVATARGELDSVDEFNRPTVAAALDEYAAQPT
jgi:hypothetical protein